MNTGRDHLAIPGPSVLPERVLRAMHRAAPNIYAGELIDLTATVVHDLKQVARCSGDVAMYLGNGHAAWEASLANTLSPGDKILALVNGRFGANWVQMARAMGVDVQVLDCGYEQPANPAHLHAALEADTAHDIRAVITVQTDTSTSVRNDLVALREAIDAARHPALYIVDCIASFACEPFDFDGLRADVMVAASQKGLMSPPGMALVFMNERTRPLHESAQLNTPYWNWADRARPQEYWQHWFGTAPTHVLFALREALDMLLEEGMDAVWERHRRQAHMVWAAVNTWQGGEAVGSESGERPGLVFQVPEPAHRSIAVTTLCTQPGKASVLRQWCEEHCGVTLGIGLAFSSTTPQRNEIFRVGHMGHLNPPMLLGTLGSIDAGLKALDLPHGRGALESVTRYLAGGESD